MNIRVIIKRLLLHSAFVPVLIFLLLIAVFLQVYFRMTVKPELYSVEPAAALPGELLVLEGDNFGEVNRDSEVLIAGMRPARSAYRSWSDSKITLTVPDDIGSGRIFVRNSKGISNGLLFTNKGHIPIVLEGPAEPGVPFIESITPDSGPVGTEISIKGMNFGLERQDGTVFFTFFSGADNEKRENTGGDSTIACSVIDFDYKSWSDQEVTVSVPDGASPGGVVLLTNRGESNSVYFEVTNPVGVKRYPRVKGYQVSYGVEISQVNSSGQASMEVWIPAISGSSAQRGIEGNYEPEPLWKDYLGVMRYNLNEFDPWTKHTLTQNYWFDRYSIETTIHDRSIQNYRRDTQLYRRYTEGGVLFPVEEEPFASAALRQARRSSSPYATARALYDYLLEKMEVAESSPAQTATEAIGLGRGDSYDYALSYVTLCRAAGIPARPVAGFIVYGNKNSRRHYWAEFYLENFGWVPVDPALGDGLPMGDLIGVDNPQQYYFGNLDNQHIVMSRGIINIPPIDPQARVVRYERGYSLQTIHEEYSRSINRYRSVWKDLEVVGWW